MGFAMLEGRLQVFRHQIEHLAQVGLKPYLEVTREKMGVMMLPVLLQIVLFPNPPAKQRKQKDNIKTSQSWKQKH